MLSWHLHIFHHHCAVLPAVYKRTRIHKQDFVLKSVSCTISVNLFLLHCEYLYNKKAIIRHDMH